MGKLTNVTVKNARPGRHSDGDGLHLLVSSSGAKSWVLRVQVNGRRRDIGLGSTSILSIAEAREKAAALRKAAKLGRDPISERDKEKVAVPSFAEAAEACHQARSPGWNPRHAAAFISTLKQHAYRRLARLRVDSVDERDIIAVLTPLWQDKPAAARKLRQQISTVLDYSKGHGWRAFGAPRDSLRPLLPKQRKGGNFPAMPYSEVPDFMALLRGRSPIASRLALQFTILTAARSGEVRRAQWREIDLDAKTWARPGSSMKSGEEHVVTLSDAAMEVLRKAQLFRTEKKDALVFPGARGQPLSDMTLLKLLKSDAPDYSVHGFRASFRTWAAEKMPNIPEAVAEAALAHTVPDAVVRAYQRSKFLEMRRTLLDAWAAFVVPPEAP